MLSTAAGGESPADEPAAVEIDACIEHLGSPSPVLKARAARRLADLGPLAAPAIPALIGCLIDPETPLKWIFENRETSVVQEAVEALVNLGESAVEPLLETLGHRDGPWRVRGRERALSALGRIGDLRAVEPLIALLQTAEERKEIRAQAATALGVLGDRRALQPLITALGAEEEEKRIRAYAARALGELGDPRALEPLIEAWKTERSKAGRFHYVGWNAVIAIGRLPDFRILETMAAVLRDPADKNVPSRYHAARWLGETGAADAVEPLIGALSDPDSGVRAAAARALGRGQNPRAIEPLVANLRRTGFSLFPDPEDPRAFEAFWHPSNWSLAALHRAVARDVRSEDAARAAAEALEQFGEASIEPLIAALGEKGLLWFLDGREAVVGVLQKIGRPAITGLVSALGSDDKTVRKSIAEVLGEIRDPEVVAALINALADGEAPVRAAAARSLKKLTSQPHGEAIGSWQSWWARSRETFDPYEIEALVGLLADQETEARVTAARTLGELADPRAADDALDGEEVAERDLRAPHRHVLEDEQVDERQQEQQVQLPVDARVAQQRTPHPRRGQ